MTPPRFPSSGSLSISVLGRADSRSAPVGPAPAPVLIRSSPPFKGTLSKFLSALERDLVYDLGDLVDRVGRYGDLLARDEDNTWVAIELKIKSATGNDLTQLLSYMQDLAFSGRQPEQIRGILIAPNFGEKVLNAATLDSRVVLLRFLSER